jgi:superfamily II DNA or RNA helicase
MEPASTLPQMPPLEEFKRRILAESPDPVKPVERLEGHRLRAGQQFAMRLASEPQRRSLFVGLPTGYGKTSTALLSFAQRHALRSSDHLLYIVPSDNLRDSVLQECHLLTELTGATVARSTMDRPVAVAQELRKIARQGGIGVVVTTIQQVALSFAHVENVLETAGGRWMVVFDEVQNYERPREGQQPGAWTRAKRALEARDDITFVLAMTGTVVRSSGHWSDFGEPDFEVPLAVAREERVIRSVCAHEIDYLIDVEMDGSIESMRLSDVDNARAAEGCASVDAWELKHNVRYFGRYITDIFAAAHGTLVAEQARDPRAAMMVFCMSVAHAKTTCDTLNRFAGKGFAEWIGSSDVGDDSRSPEENRAILRRFKEGRFHCLVQVNMATVGFNHPHVCVELWLNTIGASVYVMQGIGRALRITPKLDAAHIFYSPDHPARDIFRNLESALPSDDAEGEKSGPLDGGSGGGGDSVKFPPWQIFNARRTDVVVHTPLGDFNADSENDAHELAVSLAARSSSLTVDSARAEVDRIFREAREQQESSASELTLTERTEQARGQAEKALMAVIRTVARKTGQRQDPAWYGAMKARVHGEYKKRQASKVSQSDMTEDQLRAKHSWLEQLHAEISAAPAAGVPAWLR